MRGSFRFLFVIGDFLLLNLSILFSFYFTGHSFWPGGFSNDIYLFFFSNLAWLFLVMVSTPYSVNKGWTVSKVLKSQLAFVFIHLLVVAYVVFFFKQSYPAFQIALIYLLFVPTFFGYRIFAFYLRKVFTAETLAKNYVLIGRNELANEIRKYFLVNPGAGYRFQGYLNFDGDNFSIVAVQNLCIEKNIHEIYCCVDVNETNLKELVTFGLNSLIKVKIVARHESERRSIQLDRYDQLPGKGIATIPLDETVNQFFKRCFDIIFATLFTVFIASWLFPLIAILIKLDSPGPVFFVQLRSGKYNEPFRCLKFRTMKVNAQADTLQATKGDPRITQLGHFLRKTSIDELPQFINVLVGTMSVVGPRPHMLQHTDEYGKLIEEFMGRHYVKPGITGLAQCLGYRGETKNVTDMQNRVTMDRYYIEHWSFWFDVKIIFLTVVSLIRGSDKAF